jgi:hypothetical protein
MVYYREGNPLYSIQTALRTYSPRYPYRSQLQQAFHPVFNMFTKITATLTVLFTLTAAQLPPTLIISVIDVTTGTTLGTLNGYGNFSSPGPSYPFRAIATTGDFSDLYGFQECSADGILVCYGDDSAAPGSFFVSLVAISSIW